MEKKLKYVPLFEEFLNSLNEEKKEKTSPELMNYFKEILSTGTKIGDSLKKTLQEGDTVSKGDQVTFAKWKSDISIEPNSDPDRAPSRLMGGWRTNKVKKDSEIRYRGEYLLTNTGVAKHTAALTPILCGEIKKAKTKKEWSRVDKIQNDNKFSSPPDVTWHVCKVNINMWTHEVSLSPNLEENRYEDKYPSDFYKHISKETVNKWKQKIEQLLKKIPKIEPPTDLKDVPENFPVNLEKIFSEKLDDEGIYSWGEKIINKGDLYQFTVGFDRYFDSGAANMSYDTTYQDEDAPSDPEDENYIKPGTEYERYIPELSGDIKIVMNKKREIEEWNDDDVTWEDDEDSEVLADMREEDMEEYKESITRAWNATLEENE